MLTKDKCFLCKNNRKEFDGFVWYSGMFETKLCKSCYLSWVRSKINKEIEFEFRKAKPTTKEWHKKCETLQNEFNKWFTFNSGDKL